MLEDQTTQLERRMQHPQQPAVHDAQRRSGRIEEEPRAHRARDALVGLNERDPEPRLGTRDRRLGGRLDDRVRNRGELPRRKDANLGEVCGADSTCGVERMTGPRRNDHRRAHKHSSGEPRRTFVGADDCDVRAVLDDRVNGGARVRTLDLELAVPLALEACDHREEHRREQVRIARKTRTPRRHRRA